MAALAPHRVCTKHPRDDARRIRATHTTPRRRALRSPARASPRRPTTAHKVTALDVSAVLCAPPPPPSTMPRPEEASSAAEGSDAESCEDASW